MTNCRRDTETMTEHLDDIIPRLDELEVLLFVAQGLTTGRTQFGELEVKSDRRDFALEAMEEIRDALVYVGARLQQVRNV